MEVVKKTKIFMGYFRCFLERLGWRYRTASLVCQHYGICRWPYVDTDAGAVGGIYFWQRISQKGGEELANHADASGINDSGGGYCGLYRGHGGYVQQLIGQLGECGRYERYHEHHDGCRGDLRFAGPGRDGVFRDRICRLLCPGWGSGKACGGIGGNVRTSATARCRARPDLAARIAAKTVKIIYGSLGVCREFLQALAAGLGDGLGGEAGIGGFIAVAAMWNWRKIGRVRLHHQ